MKQRHTLFALLLVALLQVSVLAVEYLSSVYPHWSGTPIKLKTLPVDPRSLFRGNYARLSYDISTLPATLYRGSRELRTNERVYVLLDTDENGISVAQEISLHPPEQGLVIRGRIVNSSENIQIRYGIEAFFAPKQEALALEKRLSSGALAEISLASNGKAALKDVLVE